MAKYTKDVPKRAGPMPMLMPVRWPNWNRPGPGAHPPAPVAKGAEKISPRPLTLVTADLPPLGPLHFVASLLPLETFGLTLAGGCVRRHLEGYGQTDGDFDLFADPSMAEDREVSFRRYMSRIARDLPSPKGTFSWLLEIANGDKVVVQYVAFRKFHTVRNLLASFDFTINQGAVTFDERGLKLVHNAGMLEDIRDRALRPVRVRSLRGFLARYTKFARLGYYMPEDETTDFLKLMSSGTVSMGIDGGDYFDATEDEINF